MLDVMIDLETMGNGPEAAIIAVGAVEFDVSEMRIGERFYAVVDLESSVRMGGVIDASTVLWWMKQDDAARSAFSRDSKHLAEVLQMFDRWMMGRAPLDKIKVWGNGAAFDNVILAGAYRRNYSEIPWKFWNDRCYRTLKAQYPEVPMQRTGTYHNAVDDAENQARHLISIVQSMRAA